MASNLIKDMLAQAAHDKDEKAVAFLTQLCLDSRIPIETVRALASAIDTKAQGSP